MYMYLGLLASVIGLGISSYIYRKKRTKTKLMCPREGCEQVLGSRFATTLGMPNEVLGLAYYIVVGSLFAIALVYPHLVTGVFVFAITILVSFGVLFSIYLIALQAFTIRAWCIWCLGSAAANVLLLIALFGFPRAEFFSLLASHRVWWIIIHNIGFILGLGGATITDIFFFKFLKDFTITPGEKETMDTLSGIIWTGLAILIVSGMMLYLPEQARLDASPKFLLKVIVVGVVTVNGILLNLLVAPKMHTLSFAGNTPARRFRRLAFALGAISVTSWYTAFFLGSLRRIHTSFVHGLLVYILLVVGAVIGSQLYERMLVKKSGQFKKGFTLLELLVVIAVIGILAAAVLASLNGSRENAKVAAAVDQIREIRTASVMYFSDTGQKMPTCSLDCTAATDPFLTAPPGVKGWRGPYLKDGLWNLKHPWGGHFSIENYDVTGDGISDTYFFLDEDAPGTNYNNNTGVIPVSALQKIDKKIDDGNLATGNARANGLGYASAAGEMVILFEP